MPKGVKDSPIGGGICSRRAWKRTATGSCVFLLLGDATLFWVFLTNFSKRSCNLERERPRKRFCLIFKITYFSCSWLEKYKLMIILFWVTYQGWQRIYHLREKYMRKSEDKRKCWASLLGGTHSISMGRTFWISVYATILKPFIGLMSSLTDWSAAKPFWRRRCDGSLISMSGYLAAIVEHKLEEKRRSDVKKSLSKHTERFFLSGFFGLAKDE